MARIRPQGGAPVKQRFVIPQPPNPLGPVSYGLPTASRANDSGGADSRVGRSSYSSRDSHKDWGSTAPVGILRWLGHFEPSQT
jgi:hypothetical protein